MVGIDGIVIVGIGITGAATGIGNIVTLKFGKGYFPYTLFLIASNSSTDGFFPVP